MSEIIPTNWTDFCVSVQDHEKTKTSSCTFLSVLVHFNVIIPKLKDEVNSLMFFLSTRTPFPLVSPLGIYKISLCVFSRLCSCVKRWMSSYSGVSTTISACACMPCWPWRGCGAWLRHGQQKGLMVLVGCPLWSRPVWTRLKPCRAPGERRTATTNAKKLVVCYNISIWVCICCLAI